MNGLKTVTLGLFAIYWAFIVALLVFARDLYDTLLAGQLSQFMRLSGDTRPAEIATLLALSALLTLLAIGIIRAWRWTFWLILVAFVAGILHVPVSALQLAGIMSLQGPAWYVALQAAVGLIQFVIGLAMLLGYRKAGMWSGW
ncbi:MAG TPA: hypothetical protein VF808_18500 [Ktedonobacterales bacterium]